jgi:hypothetical protein
MDLLAEVHDLDTLTEMKKSSNSRKFNLQSTNYQAK